MYRTALGARGSGTAFVAFVGILLAVTLVLYYQSGLPWNRATDAVVLIFVFAAMVVSAITAGNLRSLALPLPLVLISICIVHFQFHLDFVLGLNQKTASFWADDRTVIKSLLLSAAGVFSLLIGYWFARSRDRRRSEQIIKSPKPVQTPTWPLVLLSATLLAGYFLTVNRSYLAGNYGYEEVGGVASYFIQLFTASFFGLVVLRSRNLRASGVVHVRFIDYVWYLGPVPVGLAFIYLATVIFSGDRGPIITYSLCVYFNYIYVTRRLPSLKVSLMAVAAGTIFIALLGDIRAIDRNLGFWERVQIQLTSKDTRFDEQTLIPPTQNLGYSIRTLHTVVRYVPDYHPFLNGEFQLKQILSVVPFYSVVEDRLGIDRTYRYRGSTQFTTWIVQGDDPYSGEGTTSIADLYLAFGMISVVIGMAAYGMVVGLGTSVLVSRIPYGVFPHIVAVFVFASAVYIGRAPVLWDFKIIIWSWLLVQANGFAGRITS